MVRFGVFTRLENSRCREKFSVLIDGHTSSICHGSSSVSFGKSGGSIAATVYSHDYMLLRIKIEALSIKNFHWALSSLKVIADNSSVGVGMYEQGWPPT